MQFQHLIILVYKQHYCFRMAGAANNHRKVGSSPRRKSLKQHKGNVRSFPQPPRNPAIKVMIRLIIEDKYVHARVDTGAQNTYIGNSVARYVEDQTGERAKRTLQRFSHGIETRKELKVKFGIRSGRMKKEIFHISHKLQPYEVVLGMRAIKMLGYHISIGGASTNQESYQETSVQNHNRPTGWLGQEPSYLDRKHQ